MTTPESADDEASDADSALAMEARCRTMTAPQKHLFEVQQQRPRGVNTRLLGLRRKGDGMDGASPLLKNGHNNRYSNNHKVPKRRSSSERRNSNSSGGMSTAPLYSTQSRLPPLGGHDGSWEVSPIVLTPGACGDPDCQDPHCATAAALASVGREESQDSIMSVSGSMADLVKGAKEVRMSFNFASV